MNYYITPVYYNPFMFLDSLLVPIVLLVLMFFFFRSTTFWIILALLALMSGNGLSAIVFGLIALAMRRRY